MAKYKLVPIFDEDKTVNIETVSSIEGGLNVLSKRLKETEDARGIKFNPKKTVIMMVNKKNGDPVNIDEFRAMEDLFGDQAIIINGITDLQGYCLEEMPE